MGSNIYFNAGSSFTLGRYIGHCTGSKTASACTNLIPSCVTFSFGGPSCQSIPGDTSLVVNIPAGNSYKLKPQPNNTVTFDLPIANTISTSGSNYTGSIRFSFVEVKGTDNNSVMISPNSLKLVCIVLQLINKDGSYETANLNADDFLVGYTFNYYIDYGSKMPYSTTGTASSGSAANANQGAIFCM